MRYKLVLQFLRNRIAEHGCSFNAFLYQEDSFREVVSVPLTLGDIAKLCSENKSLSLFSRNLVLDYIRPRLTTEYGVFLPLPYIVKTFLFNDGLSFAVKPYAGFSYQIRFV